jgi:hypothetical protein
LHRLISSETNGWNDITKTVLLAQGGALNGEDQQLAGIARVQTRPALTSRHFRTDAFRTGLHGCAQGVMLGEHFKSNDPVYGANSVV